MVSPQNAHPGKTLFNCIIWLVWLNISNWKSVDFRPVYGVGHVDILYEKAYTITTRFRRKKNEKKAQNRRLLSFLLLFTVHFHVHVSKNSLYSLVSFDKGVQLKHNFNVLVCRWLRTTLCMRFDSKWNPVAQL